MQRNRHLLVCLALLAVPALHADVTLRYETRTALNPSLPPQVTEAMLKGLSVSLPDKSVQQFHNGKLFYSQGKLNLVFDLAKREITMIDSEGKRYATVAADQYTAAVSGSMAQVPEQAKAMLASMKIHAEAAPGGATATIQGMQADDHAITITLDAPAVPGIPPGPMVRMAMHIWMAKSSEALRVPGLREVTGFNLMSMDAINPVAAVQKMFQQLPGFADSLAPLQKELGALSGSIMLRTQMDMFVPMLAAISAQAGAQNPLAGINADSPLVQFTQELTQISTDAIPDSVYEVPAGYQQATVAEIFKSAIPSAPAAPQTKPTPSVQSPIQVGGPIAQAVLLSQPKPVYPPEARLARVQGTVTFDAVIAKDGTVKSLQLVSGPPLLVQSALDAVKQWVYRPTLLNGEPVEVKTKVDVRFSLSELQ